ncbi:MAG: TerB family tellurite resistance protein [Ignavibacteriales bacterium]|nr:TerB family tellurite resistance protein [Ignavibacteriales bacterium]
MIESLWKLIYKDEKLNQYEDHLIKRIAATINIEHKQIIDAKLWVKQQMGLK